MLLEGLNRFITGAGAGIGRGIALQMVREGADLYLTDLNEEAAKQVASEAREARPGRASAQRTLMYAMRLVSLNA